jgi:hypothetical protein
VAARAVTHQREPIGIHESSLNQRINAREDVEV